MISTIRNSGKSKTYRDSEKIGSCHGLRWRRAGMNRWRTEGVWGSDTPLCGNTMVDTCRYNLSKPIACTTPRVTRNTNYGLQFIIIFQYWLVSCTNCTTLVKGVRNEETVRWWGGYMGTLCTVCSISGKPKTVLKHEVFLNTLKHISFGRKCRPRLLHHHSHPSLCPVTPDDPSKRETLRVAFCFSLPRPHYFQFLKSCQAIMKKKSKQEALDAPQNGMRFCHMLGPETASQVCPLKPLTPAPYLENC